MIEHIKHYAWFSLKFQSLGGLQTKSQGEHTRSQPDTTSITVICRTIQTVVKTVLTGDRWVCVISGLDVKPSPSPSELGYQWSSGQPQLSEQLPGCRSPQSHILWRKAARSVQ